MNFMNFVYFCKFVFVTWFYLISPGKKQVSSFRQEKHSNASNIWLSDSSGMRRRILSPSPPLSSPHSGKPWLCLFSLPHLCCEWTARSQTIFDRAWGVVKAERHGHAVPHHSPLCLLHSGKHSDLSFLSKKKSGQKTPDGSSFAPSSPSLSLFFIFIIFFIPLSIFPFLIINSVKWLLRLLRMFQVKCPQMHK